MPRPLALEFLTCRTAGHCWEDYRPNGKRPPAWGTRFTWRCFRCGTERHDTIDATGGLSGREYVYPEGYSMAADESPSRSQCRLDLLRRTHGRRRLAAAS